LAVFSHCSSSAGSCASGRPLPGDPPAQSAGAIRALIARNRGTVAVRAAMQGSECSSPRFGARFCLCTRCNAPCERYEGCNHVSRHRGLAAAHFILCSQPTPVGLTSVCCCPRADVLPSSGRVRSPLLLPLRLCPRWWALSRREVGSLPIVRWPTPRHCCCHG
jgi:hypothetical protein